MDDILCNEVKKKPRFVEICWQNRPMRSLPIPDHPLRPFQRAVLSIGHKLPEDRHVHWVSDIAGNSGKTHVGKLLKRDHSAIAMKGGSISNMAYVYQGEPIIVFNLARGIDPSKIPYEFMEDLKDGEIFSQKYEPCMKEFVAPHIVVLANCLPDFDKLSKDRWQIMNLDLQMTEFESYVQYRIRGGPNFRMPRATADDCVYPGQNQ